MRFDAASIKKSPITFLRRHTSATPWTYAALDQHQRAVARAIRDEGAPGALLLSEVAPVITRGRRTAPGDVLLSPALLAQSGVEVLEVDRGGLATYHGPGQWVAFAVDRLDRLTGDPRGVRKAVEGLLEAALDVGRRFDPRAEIREGAEMGVWTSRGKFAAVGVHIEQGVLLHGLSLNGFRTAQSFVGLRPCGLDAPIHFLLEDPQGFDALGELLKASLFNRFWRGVELYNLSPRNIGS